MKSNLTIKNGWLTQSKRVLSPHFSQRSDVNDISLLVIHYISLPPEQFGGDFIDRFFEGTLDPTHHPYFKEIKDLKVSAHCLINRNGEITQYVNFNDMAWHAGISQFQSRDKCNEFSIGIELEGSNEQPFTELQYQSLVKLTHIIMRNYPQITQDRIVGHCDIAPERKIDPGQYFNWDYYNQLLTIFSKKI
ncbi:MULTISPECIES: 1,6-anhydro-N-acetylmuramyl-L-alanine amidase AmpD [Pasteurellaceae]|uniref:1,6-anhydro-N-acetylmuramyl-L-alanine amidase AmpD n=1 Tax=Pasteurella atlantica TaxID=2827233 RepID=A0AAW8CNX4_9PAST|nr:1,6-anhydro-N-acetylmuramyl-L-alanine amidase AmpD [Pasteurella atlantica]MBR0573101.1 1,6-anhydro-N-acetylmuramyl-L-alanine amidase AmpD [Pasteurella atlantica]MDP8039042.1 1,6-anhydro-N-acetylmuramyl-L-alanine amidase AmpD [Pasteurella atlantica]MDP8041132.1 1,6-anhydro-N-acetylmuramyl-L-alanine amidase AmpD [Pasteurella atlantica]MDP8043255.1 1,6-anhydro-N-acetylmuramyl-L-alanine amidase AmpD [Pasteurella atlantica]MDP8045341.1 1,6-anhydro-N-acetylmuramyl-L-alanine amidase AmpD [Pasteure